MKGELVHVSTRSCDIQCFKSMMSAFPTGVVVVTTRDPAGEPRGLTCSSLVSVTLRPPTLLVCVHNNSGTLAAIVERAAFAVNFLHCEAQAAAELFAAGLPDRFERLHWRRTPSLGLPHLYRDAHAVAECRLSDTHEVGDHTLVLGEVVDATVDDHPPLLYGLREYRRWTRRVA